MFFRSLLPAFLWALFILILCAIPGQRLPSVGFLAWLKPDKLVHLFLFGLLCYLLIRGFMKQQSVPSLQVNTWQWALLVSVIYGIVIEILQEYVFTDRSGEFFDVLADTAGALAGIGWFRYRAGKNDDQSSS